MNANKLKHHEGSIYLCGFMASGKSTLGKVLAGKLGWDFRDLDTVIEEKEGMPITQIFGEKGEDHFREKEWEYLLSLTRDFKGIVALGGGALQDQRIVDHLKVHGLLVFVDTPMELITERVYNSEERPILFDKSGKIKSKETLFTELKALYSERIDLYKQAQITIRTSLYRSVQEMAEAAKDKISRHV